MRWPSNPTRQRGTAILMALMFMALSATIAVGLTFRQSISLRLTADIADIERMSLGAKQVTTWAVGQLLKGDERKSGEQPPPDDTLEQAWAKPMPQLELDGMIINGEVIDLNRFFDLNWLWLQHHTQGAESREAKAYPRRILHRLLQQVGEESGEQLDAMALTDAVSAWLSPSSNNPANSDNTSLPIIAHLPLQSVSELRLIPGISSQIYRSLSQWVAVIPFAWQRQDRAARRININTAKVEVLAALLNVTKDQLQALLDGRPYIDQQAVAGMLQRLHKQVPHAATKQAKKLLTVQSYYFLVKSQVQRQEHFLTVYTLLKRHQSGWLQEIWYSRGAQ